jgi:hypothetical protein
MKYCWQSAKLLFGKNLIYDGVNTEIKNINFIQIKKDFLFMLQLNFPLFFNRNRIISDVTFAEDLRKSKKYIMVKYNHA